MTQTAEDPNHSGPPENAEAALRKLMQQAAYGLSYAQTLTADATAIAGVVGELQGNWGETETAIKTYINAKHWTTLWVINNNIEKNKKCLENALGSRGGQAKAILEKHRKEERDAVDNKRKAEDGLTKASSAADQLQKELSVKKQKLQATIQLPEKLAVDIEALKGLEQNLNTARNNRESFKAFAIASEIAMRYEDIDPPDAHDYQKIILKQWTDVVITQHQLSKQRDDVAQLKSEVEKWKKTLKELTDNRTAVLLRRWQQEAGPPFAPMPADEEMTAETPSEE